MTIGILIIGVIDIEIVGDDQRDRYQDSGDDRCDRYRYRHRNLRCDPCYERNDQMVCRRMKWCQYKRIERLLSQGCYTLMSVPPASPRQQTLRMA